MRTLRKPKVVVFFWIILYITEAVEFTVRRLRDVSSRGSKKILENLR